MIQIKGKRVECTGFSFLTGTAASRSLDDIGTIRRRVGATVTERTYRAVRPATTAYGQR
jgi:hypothetical protein